MNEKMNNPNKQEFPRTTANREIMETVMKTITVVLASASASPPKRALCLWCTVLQYVQQIQTDSRLRDRMENVSYSDLGQ